MSSEAHNAEAEATETDKVNTGALGTLVTVGVFAMISICAAVTALVRHDLEAEQSDKDADANQTVIALKAAQRGVLNGPASYVDRGKGLVSLPIESAKQIVVAELGRDPNSATPPQAPTSEAPAAAVPAEPSAKPAADAPKKADEPGKPAHTPAAPAKPAAPGLSPTAASPGAKAPGPLDH